MVPCDRKGILWALSRIRSPDSVARSGIPVPVGNLSEACASQFQCFDPDRPGHQLRVFLCDMLAHLRNRQETLRRKSWPGLGMDLGVAPLRDSDVARMDLGPVHGRVSLCGDRGNHIPLARFDVAACMVWLWTAVGGRGTRESSAERTASLPARVARLSAMAVRRDVARALRKSRPAVFSRRSALVDSQLLRGGWLGFRQIKFRRGVVGWQSSSFPGDRSPSHGQFLRANSSHFYG